MLHVPYLALFRSHAEVSIISATLQMWLKVVNGAKAWYILVYNDVRVPRGFDLVGY